MPDKDEKGRFLPGHQWKAPAWRPGQSGHTARYTPGKLANVCAQWIEDKTTNDEPLSWSGLALHLGLSRPALDKYFHGEIGQDKQGIVYTLEVVRSFIENWCEDRLASKEYSTAGLLARLRAMDSKTWGDHKTVDITTEQRSISVVLSNMPELEQRMRDQGVLIDQDE